VDFHLPYPKINVISKSIKISVIGIFISLSIGFFVYHSTINSHTNDLKLQAIERIGLYQNSLHNELTRFNFLPFVIARDKQLIEWSMQKSDLANMALEDIKHASGANELYVMDRSGTTLSASNWRNKASFVGKNFAFRPYFKEAMLGKNSKFFGIGTASKKPGFYISTGVKDNDSIVAVTVAKIDLSILENIWIDAGEDLFVTNQDGIVILSSKTPWKYRTLKTLKASQLANIQLQKQFSDQGLRPLSDAITNKKDQLTIDEATYVHQSNKIQDTNWTIHYLTPVDRINQLAIVSWTKMGFALLAALTIVLLWWLSQSSNKLQTSLKESANLRELNDLLKTEIEHRHQVEGELRIAQTKIERASKLAAMGQLSASIIHELGQPLSAMKTYIAGAQLSENNNHENNVLPKLDALVDRMSKISQQLHFFSHTGDNSLSKVDIRDALNGALMIISPALKQDNIELSLEFEDKPYIVKGDQVRIEQVLVNLINNSRAALEFSDEKRIAISLSIKDQQNLVIKVEDTGTGIAEETLQILFDPFYTTKPSGVGLGLGLTISHNIIHELHGTLSAHNNINSGSTFIITLPIAT
jgi:two-component system C4-dicarboxylate transport sensor histidine kinase DctB